MSGEINGERTALLLRKNRAIRRHRARLQTAPVDSMIDKAAELIKQLSRWYRKYVAVGSGREGPLLPSLILIILRLFARQAVRNVPVRPSLTLQSAAAGSSRLLATTSRA